MSLGFDKARLRRIDAHIQAKYLDTGRYPHADLLIGCGDDIIHRWTAGEARAGETLKDDAIFRIASMTKPVTSIAFMQLVEEGKIALADPVHRVLPEWRNIGVFISGGGNTPFVTRPTAAPMRMIDLLRHTSGLTYSFQERSNIDAAYRKTGLERFDGGDLEQLVATLAGIPLEFDPGTAWNYSVSTDVLGAIIQRIEGKSLDQVYRERVFDPLGMKDTHFQLPPEKADRFGDCYVYDPKTTKKLYDPGGAASAWVRTPKLLSGGGGLVSTTADYHRFCRMLLGKGALEGARIVAPHTLALMTANHLPGDADLATLSKSLFSEAENAGVGFGLGFATMLSPAKAMVPGNAGEFYWGGMFSTGFFVDPVDDVIMIFMTQLMPSNAYPVRREIKTMLYAALE
ncbi:MAG: beta-lactamase family protein [Sphingomonadaceae bacterium]|nr:beta-lactamase family protein [Sphingomonadaceae bacterium]